MPGQIITDNLLADSIKGDSSALSRGLASIALSDANYTVPASEYSNMFLVFSGTLTASRDIVLPNTSGAVFLIVNTTGQSLVCKVSGQTGVTVAAAKTALIYCNGTDYARATADV